MQIIACSLGACVSFKTYGHTMIISFYCVFQKTHYNIASICWRYWLPSSFLQSASREVKKTVSRITFHVFSCNSPWKKCGTLSDAKTTKSITRPVRTPSYHLSSLVGSHVIDWDCWDCDFAFEPRIIQLIWSCFIHRQSSAVWNQWLMPPI